MSEVYAGQIKSITGKIQVTETHGTNTGKQAARIEDLRALSDEVVHKTINGDKTESVTISGTLTTDQINTETVVANDSISVSNTKLNATGFETDGRAAIGGDVEIGGKLTVKGQDGSETTDQSLAIVAPVVEIAVKTDEDPVIVAKVTDEGIQTEIKADTVKTAANKEVEISASDTDTTATAAIKAKVEQIEGVSIPKAEISATEVITEASSKSTIIAPEIWLKDSNSDSPVNYIKVEHNNNKVVLNAPNINLFANSAATSLKVNNIEGITAETASTILLKANDNTYVQLNNAKNEVILKATTISLDSAATNTAAQLTYDSADSEFRKVKTHTGDDIIADPTGTTGNRIVNNNALRSYNRAVDAKITTTKAELQGSIKDINDNLGTKPANTTTVWKEIKAIQDNISNGLHFRGIFTDKNNVDNPKSGDLIIIGTQEYVYNGTTWQELGDENTHATKTELNNKVAELVAEDADIRVDFAAADAFLKSELEGKINEKVAQGDFEALEGRVGGHDAAIADKLDSSVHTKFVEDQVILDAGQDDRIKAVEDSLKAEGDTYKAIAAKLESSVYETHITAYNNKVSALEATDESLGTRITNIETSLSTGDIHTEIDGVRTLAQQGVNDAAAVSNRVTTLENKLPSQYKLDTGLFGELETDTEGNLTGALIIRTVQKQAAAVNGINNNEVY